MKATGVQRKRRRVPCDDPARLTRQLSLGLGAGARTHGGARRGAGRPRKGAAHRLKTAITHRPRASHRKGDPVHVTLRVAREIPSLRRQAMEKVIKRALLAQRSRLDELGSKRFQLVHFTIQDDHMHLIVEANDKRTLSSGVAGLVIRIARRVNKLLGRNGRFWAERYHRRDLRTPTETRNALRYVLLNSQKHTRILGSRDFACPHSSAASFDGFTHGPHRFDELVPWPLVAARTWLLARGWQRYGLIDPREPPPSVQV